MARRICRQPAVAGLLLLFFCLAIYQAHIADVQYPVIGKGLDIDQLPPEYARPATQSQFCENRFGKDYLVRFVKNAATYCENDSNSELTCFSNNVDLNGARTDTFCIGGPAVFDPQKKQFSLACKIRAIPSDEISTGVVPYPMFAEYLYETGPSYILNRYIDYTTPDAQVFRQSDAKAPIAVLVKREVMWRDTWHGLLAIMSTYLTLDVLRMANNPATEAPYFSTSDFDNTQVVLLDDAEDGPYVDLWRLFARKPVLRISNLTQIETQANYSKIITPLPSGSNTLWQGDWQSLDCQKSTLLAAFSNRVLYAYNIPTTIKNSAPSKPNPIQLVFVNHTTDRRLLQMEERLASLRLRYSTSTLHIHIVDYDTMTFADQLRITHASADILVGVHSADLTHTMFLRPGSALIEIMPFNNVNHLGFQNLAALMDDVHYFRGATEDNPSETKASGDWQHDDVWMGEQDFLQLTTGVVDRMARKRGLI